MFSIGEFAKIARVSKRLLDHYDEIGLLRPITINHSNSYRFYSPAQLSRLNQILALKDLGISLPQIEKMLDEHIPDREINEILIERKVEIEQTIAVEMERLSRIEARLRQNQAPEDPLNIVIKSVPEQYYLATQVPYTADEITVSTIDQIIRYTPEYVKKSDLGHFASIYQIHQPFADKEAPFFGYLLKNRYSSQPTIQLASDIKLQVRMLPRVEEMVTYVQPAVAEEQSFVVLGRIAAWIEENGYRVIGRCREISYNFATAMDYLQATVEIQIPIESA